MRIADINKSSAGNTRGLIEARVPHGLTLCNYPRLPRGIPAASLKQIDTLETFQILALSSAGNTRGLIEAAYSRFSREIATCLPRGIPAASLKPTVGIPGHSHSIKSSAGNTRGLIEASD